MLKFNGFRIKKIAIVLVTLIFLPSCQRNFLHVRSDFLTSDYLASKRIETPDPLKECYRGQQIVMRWRVPASLTDSQLFLSVRYGNLEVENFVYKLQNTSDFRIFRLINDEYWCKGGIISYKAQIMHEREVIFEKTHHVWADIIQLHSIKS